MPYKKKLAALLCVNAGLALVLALTFVFEPERLSSRSEAYSWLDPAQTDRISGITITGPGDEDSQANVSLERSGGRWFVSLNGKDYPARQARVEDFIAALAKKAPYPVRSSSASSHERLLLTDDSSVTITVFAGSGPPLLRLLVGQPDITGQNIYLRRQGENEVRSGEDIFSAYTKSARNSWYNLRLFPESEDGKLDAASVQRLTVYASESGDGPPMVFTRKGKEWSFSFELADPDMGKVDGYIRDIINTAGDDFSEELKPSDPVFNDSRIVLDIGDGSIKTVRLGPPDENGRRFAVVSGADLVYSLPGWAGQRLFADSAYFEKD